MCILIYYSNDTQVLDMKYISTSMKVNKFLNKKSEAPCIAQPVYAKLKITKEQKYFCAEGPPRLQDCKEVLNLIPKPQNSQEIKYSNCVGFVS